MRRLLIVSPHFPPVSTADMQRVRVLLPYFRENGWEAEVLAISPEGVAAPRDPGLVDTLPQDVPVRRVAALSLRWSRIPGFGTLGLRAVRALQREGDRLLKSGRFDLVYFSTTVFEVHILGPRWRHKFGTPFVIDYQDPWVNDYYRNHPNIVPPGGRVKYALADALHRWMEPRVLRACAGITAVSSEYPRQLARRYSWYSNARELVQAFPAPQRDFEVLSKVAPAPTLFDESDGRQHWVYVGRGGNDMAKALRAFFGALQGAAFASLRQNLMMHFIGTSYAAAGKGAKSIAPIAAEFGLASIVDEQPDRISYSQALSLLRRADALVVFGSDDPAYTASKIHPYLLARRPMLAVFHSQSSVCRLIAEVGGAVCVSFDETATTETLGERIADRWLRGEAYMRIQRFDGEAFQAYGDRACAAELSVFFDGCFGVSEGAHISTPGWRGN
jgi:hypothetical protein